MGNWVLQSTLVIGNVDLANSTFSGTYGTLDNGTMATYPFHGEFDPTGITVGWLVSFRNQSVNHHALGAWSGYYSCLGEYPKNYIRVTKIITYPPQYLTKTGVEMFELV